MACLLGKRMDGGCGLLDHRRILLRGLIHLVDRGVDFLQPRRLFFAPDAICSTTVLMSLTCARMRSSAVPVSATSVTPCPPGPSTSKSAP